MYEAINSNFNWWKPDKFQIKIVISLQNLKSTFAYINEKAVINFKIPKFSTDWSLSRWKQNQM